MGWLPPGFEHPVRVPVDDGHHLRPIRADDVHLDHPAVMGSQARLWSVYGEAWGWPPSTLTVEQDREDLARHEREMAARRSFDYALLDAAETRLLGCVYVDPPEDPAEAADAVVSWWVVDEVVGTDLERALDDLVPRWLEEAWPFAAVRVGPWPPGYARPPCPR